MPTNQQLPLSVSIAVDDTADLLCPSTDGMGLNRGVVLAVTIQPQATTFDITVTVLIRTTPGLYGGKDVVTADVSVPLPAVVIVPAGSTPVRFTVACLGDFVRLTGEHDGGVAQVVVVSAEVLGAAS